MRIIAGGENTLEWKEMDSLTIRKPDDWHVHLREGAILNAVLPYTERVFGRAIVMPNLATPVVKTHNARMYREEILARRANEAFTPLMTLYLTDETDPRDVEEGVKSGIVTAVKYYPKNATTHSVSGVTDITRTYPVLSILQERGTPLLMHGESVEKDGVAVEPADREKVFLEGTLPTLIKDFPELKIVLEHASTKDAVEFVQARDSNLLASTITVHHLILTEHDAEGDAHLSCMPVVKTDRDRAALRKAATSGDAHFFLGTDSAPHPVSKKLGALPPAGIFSAPAALEMYAGVFEEENALSNLESFASLNGPAFYGLPANTATVSLYKKAWTPTDIDTSDGEMLRPLGDRADREHGIAVQWSATSEETR